MAQGDPRARVRAMEEIDESLGKYIVYYLAATQETEGTVGAQCMVGWVDKNIPTRAFPICVEPAIIGVTESEDGFALLVESIKRYEGAIKSSTIRLKTHPTARARLQSPSRLRRPERLRRSRW